MLGGNLGSLLYGNVSVIESHYEIAYDACKSNTEISLGFQPAHLMGNYSSSAKAEVHQITCPCNVDHLTPHFYIVNLGYTGLYIIILFCSRTMRRF